MRRVFRIGLPQQAVDELSRRQRKADAEGAKGPIDVERAWRLGRKAKGFASVAATLRKMAGRRERCMYCVDSHACDVEHFWPKRHHPARMFRWENLLFCCTECGRFKGTRFPLDDDGRPLLVDPAAEDPWRSLDFDPDTGNVMARFDGSTNQYAKKGVATVECLQLDQREAVTEGFRSTFRRLAAVLEGALQAGGITSKSLLADLREVDEHGLLGWCFSDRGCTVSPFRELYADHRLLWDECAASLS